MPLSEVCRAIACLLQEPGQQRSLRTQPVRHVAFLVLLDPRKVTVDVVPRGKVASNDGSTTGRTYSTGHGEPMEVLTLLRQAINVWRLNVGMPMTTQIAPAPVVSKDEQYVRSFRRRTQRSEWARKQEQETGKDQD